MNLRARVALIDIEGTVGSMAFVHDVLFPFAQERLDAYVRTHAHESAIRALLDSAAAHAGLVPDDLDGTLQALHAWAAQDRKVTPLKELQGLIWAEGYESSGMRGHLYEDAIAALRRFHAAGVALYIYSSGSIVAQKLLFGHSVAGDLLPLFSGFFDTTIGGKRESESYARITREIRVNAPSIVFFSDNIYELNAARATGMQTVQLARPEDGTVAGSRHPAVATFEGIVVKPA